MIIADIHSHILPGVDDGSPNFQTTIQMLENAYRCGTRHIVATPHYCYGKFMVDRQEMYDGVERLREEMFKRDINIEIYPGHEARCASDLVGFFKENKISTLNDAGFLLLELPFSTPVVNFNEIYYHIQSETRTRIIFAHPERHEYVTSRPEIVESMAEHGILLQVNADSIRGRNGKNAKMFVERLMKKGLVSFVASDAHDNSHRTTSLDDVYLKVKQKYGDETAKKIFYKNQMNILKGLAPI